MATTEKKYLSLAGLQAYDAKIKELINSQDAATLKSAKDYADGLADNYDAAGTAETKVQELANGQVKTNKEAIDAINHETNGILAQAKNYADGKDGAIAAAKKAGDDAQADIDALVEGDIATMKGQIDALIAGTYDDTEVRGLIKTNADDIDALEGRADAVEGKVTTLIGDDANKSVRTIANEELVKQLIADNAADALDSLEEIAAWIQSHPGDASAMNKAITDLEALVGTLPAGITATTVVGYIQEAVAAAKQEAIDSAKGYTDQEIGKIDLSGIADNAGEISALKGRMDTAEGDIDALEASLAEGGATALAIADAKKAGTDAAGAVTALENGKVATLRTDVDNLMSVSYVEITTGEINAMFA